MDHLTTDVELIMNETGGVLLFDDKKVEFQEDDILNGVLHLNGKRFMFMVVDCGEGTAILRAITVS